MRKLALAIVLALTLAANCTAGEKSVIEAAWRKAMKLAEVYPQEEVRISRPKKVEIVYEPRYIPMSPTTGNRLCGITEPFFEIDPAKPDRMKLVFYVGVYVRPNEKELLLNVLAHEFLHIVWVERALRTEGWTIQHPGNEEWVRELIPESSCPEI